MRSIELTQIPLSRVANTLKRRRRHLENRIANSDMDLSYDKAEVQALSYAIALVCSLKHCKYLLGTLEANRSAIDEDGTVQN